MNATTPATTAPRRSRRLLVPLATLAAAGALVVGSGATFSSTSDNTTSIVTAGSLTQDNSKAGAAIFDVANIKPGDTVTGEVTITNDGTLPAAFKVTEVDPINTFTTDVLTMTVTDDNGGLVYEGAFGGMGVKTLGEWVEGESRTFTYVVELAADAGNLNQLKTASASYQWDAIQLNATDVDQTDVVTAAEDANPDLTGTNG